MNEKITTGDTYSEDTMFSLTKLIKISYDNHMPLSKEIIKKLDLNEITEMSVNYREKNNHSYNVEVKDNLALNIMSRLPLRYYEDYIDIGWIYYGKKYEPNFVSFSLYCGALDTVNKILDLGDKIIDNYQPHQFNTDQKKLSDDYNRFVLQPIINVKSYLAVLKHRFQKHATNENKVSYDHILHKALKQFETFYNSNASFNHQRNIFDSKQWFNQYDHFNGPYKTQENQEEIIKLCVQHSEVFPVLVDIFNQIKDKSNIVNLDNLKRAFIQGNSDAVDFIVEHLKIDNKNGLLKSIFDQCCDELNNDISTNYARHSNDIQYQLKKVHNILTLSQHYMLDFSQTPLSKLIDFYTIANDDTIGLLKSIFPINSQSLIIEQYNFTEIIYMKTLLDKFLSTYKLTLNQANHDIYYPTKELHLFAILQDNFSGIKHEKLRNERKGELHAYIVENILEHINLSTTRKNSDPQYNDIEEIKIAFNVLAFDSTLSTKTVKSKRNKL